MTLILNIDTAIDTACISLAEDGKLVKFIANPSQKDHAAWVQEAIQRLVNDSGYGMHDIKAVGVSIGPGSYTGLRIGLSTAKGLCYALAIPLITVNTLEMMALAAIKDLEMPDLQPIPDSSGRRRLAAGAAGLLTPDSPLPTPAAADRVPPSALAVAQGLPQAQPDSGLLTPHSPLPTPDLFCPMIDARRMEVFAAVYNSSLDELVKPHACILEAHSFEELLKGHKILFLGNGSIKFQQICQNRHAMFKKDALNPAALAALTYRNFIGNNFAGLAYTEPLYIKEFFTK